MNNACFSRLLIPAVILSLVMGCNPSEESTDQNSNETSLSSVIIKVETVQCSMCVDAIESALSEVEGVDGAKVDLVAKIATVRFHPTMVDVKGLELAVTEAGYDANGSKRNQVAYDQLPDCCKIE